MNLTINKNADTRTNFTAIYINRGKMSQTQKVMSEALCDAMKYCDSYQSLAENPINAVILPGKQPTSILVQYIDNASWMYVKNKVGNVLKREFNEKSYKKIYEFADAVIQDLSNIINNKIERPKVDADRIFSGDTDLARLDRSMFADVSKFIRDSVRSGLSESESRAIALDGFANSPSKDRFIG